MSFCRARRTYGPAHQVWSDQRPRYRHGLGEMLDARMYIETVVMPASSNARATCPTDTWHTGHVATSRQTSTPSARNFSPQLGAISFRSRSWDAAPTKE